jgi:CheY-like chemotaxis protein
MDNQERLHFIVLDDSKLDCFIAEKVIQNMGRSESVRSFMQATEALSFIQDRTEDQYRTILFVDIQMPVMNGFEFVEAFDKLPAEKRANYIVFMLSSSINENDLARVKTLPTIRKFINKPLTGQTISVVLEDLAG